MSGRGLRQSMAWIHAWLGLLAGWILFAMFLTGTASYFRPEITRWMEPELKAAGAAPAAAAEAAVGWLQATYPGDTQWMIYLPDGRTGATRVFTRPPQGIGPAARRPELRLDPASGEPVAARETRGGEHFYRFHFQLQLPHPWGRWLAGLAALFMLGAIVSGVITHRRILADLFTLRWGKGQRSWLDAHIASAVLALPFHAMITYSGLIALMVMYMPWPIAVNYASPAAFTAEAYGQEPAQRASGQAAPLVSVAGLVEAAEREWGGRAGRVVIRHPGDAAATVTVVRSGADTLNARGASITYAGVDGRRLSAAAAPGPAVATAGVLLGLHMGWFAGPFLRVVYFLLGLSGTAMVGTGLVLWTAKRRRPGRARFVGLALVERLNIATIACLPAGMAAFLLANRLIAAELPGRAGLEVAAMYWGWFGLAAMSLLRPAAKAWPECLAVSAVAFLLVPVVNALTTDRGLAASLASGDTVFAAFDAAMLVTGALLAFAAWRATRPGPARLPATRDSEVTDAA